LFTIYKSQKKKKKKASEIEQVLIQVRICSPLLSFAAWGGLHSLALWIVCVLHADKQYPTADTGPSTRTVCHAAPWQLLQSN
jgi:hypothetical protein